MKRDENSKNAASTVASVVWNSFADYMKKQYPVVILVFATFVFCVTLSFVKISTATTISSFNIDDYEIGQIADTTIVSSKFLPSDLMNPIEIDAGEKIIRKGFPITEEGYAKLKKMSESPVYVDYRSFANSVIFHILMCFLFFFFNSRIYFKSGRMEFRELVTECFFYVLVFGSVIFGSKSSAISTPFALCAVIPSSLCVFLVSILFGQLNAVFFSLMISLLVLNGANYQIVPFLFVLSTSLASTRLVRKIDRRTDMVLVSVLQALLDVVFLLVFKIIFNDSISSGIQFVFGVALNGFFSGILCLGLLTPLELLLNTSSVFRLMDLSDLNNPTMKKMLVTASGTYNHSLMVASLAEAACNEVGANPLLARVGAYYHDIGKMDNPDYFVENQSSGENIHNEINPSLSVSIIRSHVKRGMEKARALRLPKQIIDIIGEHHGNQVIAYFYNEAKKINPDANPEDYAYTGNPPVTRESAIVMLSDTVEAACRTLEKPSVPRLEKFISTLINGKIETKQLENCNLTFSDLTKIHDAFVQILAGYYHSRTKYPDQKDPDSGETAQIPQKENSAEEKSVNSAEEKSEKSAEKIEKSDEKSAKSAEKEKIAGNSAEKNDEKPAEKEKEKSAKKSAREKKQ